MYVRNIDDNYSFNQCIVNNYEAGQGISKRTDVSSYGDVIGCYTFGSGATMVFKKYTEKYELYVEPNSLYIMSGDARYKWTHEMLGKHSDMVLNYQEYRSRLDLLELKRYHIYE